MNVKPLRRAAPESVTQKETREDSDLLARVACGDQQALASLYDRHSKMAYSVALRVCRDSALAEAVLQEVFMDIWRDPQRFSSVGTAFGGLLVACSRNRSLDVLRMERGETLQSAAPGRHDVDRGAPGRTLEEGDALGLATPETDHKLLEMAFFDGKTVARLAEDLGCSAGTIKSRLCSAMSQLKKHGTKPTYGREDTGLEVLDLDSHLEFAMRPLRLRDFAVEMEGVRRITRAFVQNPDAILQELVNAAVDLCGADSAGISLEGEEKRDDAYWHWVAIAGAYNGFLNAILPRYPSACGICLERGKPQLFRVGQRFFDIMGINAPLVTDGILLPWQVEQTRGTIFIMAHGRTAAFDGNDGQLMQVLADFAAMAVTSRKTAARAH